MVKAVAAEFRRLVRVLAPDVAQLPPDLRGVNVGQNVLRACITATLAELIPYPPETAIELARRSASYALSVVPLEDQDAAVAAFLDGFADFHLERTARGQVIEAHWKMDDGEERPNFPAAENHR